MAVHQWKKEHQLLGKIQMAKQPRQQRILSYGEFRPTGVDDSAARRMQALAGLGETVAGVAERFGRAKATEIAPEQAQKAAEKAI